MSPRALIPVPVLLAVLAGLPTWAMAAVEKAPGIGLDVSSLPLAAPGGDVAYVTRDGKRTTRLLETPPDGGAALRALRIPGSFALPAVAYDGLPAGLSADGRTLMLVNPRRRFPRANTTLAIVDPRGMRLRGQIRLRGDFSFDAISPDGRLLYLIQYLSKRDITDYAVRAYDVRARRLLRQPVVDPREPEEDMSGEPLSRVMDATGRWAYTLYASEEHPFVHALDTERAHRRVHRSRDPRRRGSGDARRPARRSGRWAGTREHRHVNAPGDRRPSQAPRTGDARHRGGRGLPVAADRRADRRPDAARGGGPATLGRSYPSALRRRTSPPAHAGCGGPAHHPFGAD